MLRPSRSSFQTTTVSPVTDVLHQRGKAGAVVLRARHGVGERLRDARCGKSGVLLIQGLGNGADSRVTSNT